jgi:Lon protease-like protein
MNEAPLNEQVLETFIFPLNTVLFPGGVLPLKIFEQRYIEMTKACISASRPFGVCLIKEGQEVGAPAVPHEVGCLARITQWDMPQLGVFQLQTEGTQRLRILSWTTARSGLISASVELLAPDADVEPRDARCPQLLHSIIHKIGAEHIPGPHRLDNAAWVGYRLAEILPISLELKQQLLELTDPQQRLVRLSEMLTQTGVQL